MEIKSSSQARRHQLSSNLVSKELGKVTVQRDTNKTQVVFTILMEPQGENAEGWQTGVALDASASMRNWYGRSLLGSIPADIRAQYERNRWIRVSVEDGKQVKIIQPSAYEDAIAKGYLQTSENIIQPLTREFISYLSGNLDADGGTTLIYWAGGDDGSAIEVISDVTQAECQSLTINGPTNIRFGLGTALIPALKYFVNRFAQAKRGMYIFITDGRIDDLDNVKEYTKKLANQIESGHNHLIKCVLIGVGSEIDQAQLEELDDLDTGTNVDIWDYKIADEMSGLVEIFAEVVDENQIIAPTASIYDSSGVLVKKFSDGLPAKVSITLSPNCEWFEIEVCGQRIHQTLICPEV